MNTKRQIELRIPDKLWATVEVSEKEMVLRHSLSRLQIVMCPGVVAYENGLALKVAVGEKLILSDPNGLTALKLNIDSEGVLTDVVDPLGKANLAVELRGSGSAGDELVRAGELVLNLKSTTIG